MNENKKQLIRKITREQFIRELQQSEMQKLHQPEYKHIANTTKKITNYVEDMPMLVKSEPVEFVNNNDDVYKDVFIHFSANQVRAGIIKELVPEGVEKGGMIGARNFTVLMAIASFMDAEGKAFPSQRTLQDITGMSRSSIGKATADLGHIRIAGHKLLTVVKEKGYRNIEKSVYYFNPGAVIEMIY